MVGNGWDVPTRDGAADLKVRPTELSEGGPSGLPYLMYQCAPMAMLSGLRSYPVIDVGQWR